MNICPTCGQSVTVTANNGTAAPVPPVPPQEQYQNVQQPLYYQQPVYQQPPIQQPQPQGDGSETKLLVFGILSLALGTIPGLIFSIITLNKTKAYIAQFGQISTKVKVARILSIVGLIYNIVAIVFVVLYFSIVGCVLCTALNSGITTYSYRGPSHSYYYNF